ncbi:MAG: hypothetical protein M3186_03830 [Actinomycetota bacterium]|nr:hypothetical protein [Actinomycetota bacterium]
MNTQDDEVNPALQARPGVLVKPLTSIVKAQHYGVEPRPNSSDFPVGTAVCSCCMY